MKTLSALLGELVSQRVLAEVPAIVIEPVSDHVIPTIDPEEVFTSSPVVRLIAAAASASPLLQSVRFPTETMSHLPSARGGATDTLRRQVQFSLINSPFRGFDSVFDYLTRNAPLDRADLSLELVTLPSSAFQSNPVDFLTAGGESNTVFEGQIDRVVAVGAQVQCFGRTDLPVVPWKLVPDAANDDRDRGLRLPFVLGSRTIARCVNLDVGEVTTISAPVLIGDTEVSLQDASGWPAIGSAMLGAEKIAWDSVDGSTLKGVVRGQSGTFEANHVFGAQIVELQPIVLGVSSSDLSAVTGLFILSTEANAVVPISTLLYTVDYDDQTTAPGASGDGIVTATLSALQLASLLNGIQADASVIQQPVFSSDNEPLETERTDVGVELDNVLIATSAGALGDWTNTTGDFDGVSPPTWTLNSGSADQQSLRVSWDNLPPTAQEEIRSIRFDFTLNVTTLVRGPITFGLTATGIEGVLIGIADGELVSTIEINSTGSFKSTGSTYRCFEGSQIRDLDAMTADLIKSEVRGENPSIVVEVTDVSVTYFTFENLAEVDANGLFGAQYVHGTTAPSTGQGPNRRNISIVGVPPTGLTAPSPTWKLNILNSDFRHTARNKVSLNQGGSGTTAPSIVADGESIVKEVVFHFAAKLLQFSSGSDRLVRFSFTGSSLQSPPSTVFQINLGQVVNNTDSINADITSQLKPGVTFQNWDLTVFIWIECTGGDADEIELTDHTFDIKYLLPSGGFVPIPRVDDTRISASAGGVGLDFYAECDGPLAPDDSYSVLSGELLLHPSDIARYWLQAVGGFVAGDVDNTTFDQAVTDLPNYEFGFDARNLGESWEDVLLRIGYESRANLARPSGGDWKMFTATTSHAFPAVVATVAGVENLNAIHKDDEEFLTRLIVYFDHDPRFASADNRSFLAVQTTDPTDSEVVTREKAFGRKDADPMFLFCHNGENAAGVTDWREYMEQELGRDARLFTARVDHWEAYPLEIGDSITLTTPDESVKCRVLETTRDARQGFLMRFVEVL